MNFSPKIFVIQFCQNASKTKNAKRALRLGFDKQRCTTSERLMHTRCSLVPSLEGRPLKQSRSKFSSIKIRSGMVENEDTSQLCIAKTTKKRLDRLNVL